MDSILSVLTTIASIFGVVMLFNFMIFIHELGHFFAARWRGRLIPLGRAPDAGPSDRVRRGRFRGRRSGREGRQGVLQGGA